MSETEIEAIVARALEQVRPEYLSRNKLAAELGVTLDTLRSFEARGLPGHQLGPRTYRFIRSEVDAWIRSQEGKA